MRLTSDAPRERLLKMNKYKLLDIREVWKNAYRNVETDWLLFLEAPFYFAKRGANIISRAEQIAYLERNREKILGRQKNASDDYREEIKEVHERDGWATVAGSIISRDFTGNVNYGEFLEVWIFLTERWQIASLCIDEKSAFEPRKV